MKLSGLGPRCAGQEKARKEVRLCLADAGRCRRDLSLGTTDIRASLQKVGWEANANVRSCGRNRIRLLQLTTQGAGFFSEENAQTMNGNVDSAEEGGNRSPCGFELRRSA